MQRQADNECSEERAEQRGGEVCEAGGEVDEAGGEVGEAGRRMKCRERERGREQMASRSAFYI